eukprot:comp24610_c0_seq1/m.46798 comp24610_c0_seq1/g.46798  ORF comp24610_c0_seq1/g.46798 comp24610_c0_seq1/m.46798 type:complete len:245 (-) comp24610_c0_seq1:540-1274(-)
MFWPPQATMDPHELREKIKTMRRQSMKAQCRDPGAREVVYVARCEEKMRRIEHRLLVVRERGQGVQEEDQQVPDDEHKGLALCIHLARLDPSSAHVVLYKDREGKTARIIIAPRTAEDEVAVLKQERHVLAETVTTLESENEFLKFKADRLKEREERIMHQNNRERQQLEREHLLALSEIERLKHELESLRREEMCVVCYDSPRNVVFQCGHRSVCSDCDKELEVHDNRCPLCRADVVFRICTL